MECLSLMLSLCKLHRLLDRRAPKADDSASATASGANLAPLSNSAKIIFGPPRVWEADDVVNLLLVCSFELLRTQELHAFTLQSGVSAFGTLKRFSR